MAFTGRWAGFWVSSIIALVVHVRVCAHMRVRAMYTRRVEPTA